MPGPSLRQTHDQYKMTNFFINRELSDDFFKYAQSTKRRKIVIRPHAYFVGYIDALEIVGAISKHNALKYQQRIYNIFNLSDTQKKPNPKFRFE